MERRFGIMLDVIICIYNHILCELYLKSIYVIDDVCYPPKCVWVESPNGVGHLRNKNLFFTGWFDCAAP